MKFDKQIDRMKRRLDDIALVQQPPTLSMMIIGENDPEPKFNQWNLLVRIEEKPRLVN